MRYNYTEETQQPPHTSAQTGRHSIKGNKPPVSSPTTTTHIAFTTHSGSTVGHKNSMNMAVEQAPATPSQKPKKNFKIANTKEPSKFFKLLSPGIPKQLEKRKSVSAKPVRVNGKKLVNGKPSNERRKSMTRGRHNPSNISPPSSMPTTTTSGRTPKSAKRKLKLKVKDMHHSHHGSTEASAATPPASQGISAPPLSSSSHHRSANSALLSPRSQHGKRKVTRHRGQHQQSNLHGNANEAAHDISHVDIAHSYRTGDSSQDDLDDVMTMAPPPPPLSMDSSSHHHRSPISTPPPTTPKGRKKSFVANSPVRAQSQHRRMSTAARVTKKGRSKSIGPMSRRAAAARAEASQLDQSLHTDRDDIHANDIASNIGEMNLNDNAADDPAKRGPKKRSQSLRKESMAERHLREQQQEDETPKRSKSRSKSKTRTKKRTNKSSTEDIEAKVLLLKRRKELVKLGIPQEEIDLLLPLPTK